MYAPKDDSFSLVRENELICDSETVKVNDELEFFFNKEIWKGKVIALGGT